MNYEDKKIVGIISSNVEPSIALNVIGHLAISIGKYSNDEIMGQPTIVDKSGVSHLGISQFPFIITKVKQGKYITIFEYDTEKYVLTKYQAEGVQADRNSDVENVTMNLEGTSKKVASTDTIEIKGNSVTNIDIGLIEAKIFDLSLSKTVKKVTVTNKAGTQTKEYNDTQLAKTEIKAKNLKGTTVVIEYKIKVTNEGELAGYVRRIVDYKPSDLTFNSSLNPDWYQAGQIQK